MEEINQIVLDSIPNACKLTTKPVLKSKEKWFDTELFEARKKSFGWLKILRKYPHNDFYRTKYLQVNKEFKNLRIVKRRNHTIELSRKISECSNASSFWKTVREIEKKVARDASIPIELRKLMDYFSAMTKDNYGNTFQFAIPNLQNNTLDAEFTVNEVEAALKESKNDKAPGSDGIPMEFFKFSTTDLILKLTAALNWLLASGSVPEYFNKALLKPILKKGEPSNPENYRYISVLNASMKILTKILSKRLYSWIQKNNLLSENQAGFRRDYSTVDQIYVLTNVAEMFINKKKKFYAFFIDFKAAFDTIDRKALMMKLYNKGMSLKFGKIIESLYAHTTSAIVNGFEISDEFEVEIGLRQGCNLRPLLFVLFIDDLNEVWTGEAKLSEMLVVSHLMFADDIVALSETPHGLRLMLNRLAEHRDKWRLQVNLGKKKIMIFRNAGGRNCQYEKWKFAGCDIEVSEYNYLRVLITRNLNFKKHVTGKLAKSKSAINATWRSVMSSGDVDSSAKYHVFEGTAKSIMCYAAQSWGHMEFEEVEELLRYFLKRIFKLPQSTPNNVLLLETGLSPLYISTLKMQVDYIIRTLSMDDERLPKKRVYHDI